MLSEFMCTYVLCTQAIMRTLLGYIGKEKHADSLVEKLMLRFEAAACALQWRNLAFCLTQVRLPSYPLPSRQGRQHPISCQSLSLPQHGLGVCGVSMVRQGCMRVVLRWLMCATCVQLNFTEKGLRKMMEMAKSFRHALASPETLDTFKACPAAAYSTPLYCSRARVVSNTMLSMPCMGSVQQSCHDSRNVCACHALSSLGWPGRVLAIVHRQSLPRRASWQRR